MEWNQFLQFVLIICTMTFRDLATLAIATLEHVIPYAITFDDIEKLVSVLGVNFIPDNAYLVYMLEHYDQNDDKHLTLSEYLCFAEEQQYLYKYLLSFQTQLQKLTLSNPKWEDVVYRKNNIEIILKYESINGKNVYPKLSCNERCYRYFEGLKHPYYYNFSYLNNKKDNNIKPCIANKRHQQLLLQFISQYDPSFRKRIYHNIGNGYSESRLNSVSSSTTTTNSTTYPTTTGSKSIQSTINNSTSLVIFTNTPKTTINYNTTANNTTNTQYKSRLSSVTSLSQRRINNANVNNNNISYNAGNGILGINSTTPNIFTNENNLLIRHNQSHHLPQHTVSVDEGKLNNDTSNNLLMFNSQRERHVNSAVVLDRYKSSTANENSINLYNYYYL